jgi:two-component system catabolic regulation response regulator CreB
MLIDERPRILLIEDEPAIADTLVYALATEGFEPDWQLTGREGLQVIRHNPPALVLLDIGLPDINGFELFKTLRGFSAVPVIFLTARSGEIDRVVGLELGADDYVSKPFSPRELTARVKAVLRRSAPATDNRPAATDNRSAAAAQPLFTVDEQRFEISYGGSVLDLSRYEYRLLRLLIHNPQRVYSREQLLLHVWDNPEHSMDRTVDSHIKTLRAKLRAVRPDSDPVKTHRGIGYSLSLDP